MMLVRDYVRHLDDDTRIQIIRDYESFERNGTIGTSELRRHAEIILSEIGGDKMKVVMWMEILIKEVYRYFALQYIKNI